MRPYQWNVAAGALPIGLSLTSAGRISGYPRTPGAYPITIRMRDASGLTKEQKLELKVMVSSLVISTDQVPTATVGVMINRAMTASGGILPYTWMVDSGMLPSGVTLRYDGLLTGVPGASGTYRFVIRVADKSGLTSVKPYTLSVGTKPLVITSTFLPQASARKPYSAPLVVTGGVKPYTWSLLDGVLPSGMNLSRAGVLSGPPWAPGTYRFTAQATDTTAANVTKSFELRVE